MLHATSGSEGNEITDAQVKAANTKNWHPLKCVNYNWVEIEVNDDSVLGDVNGDGMVDVDDVNAVINIMLDIAARSNYAGNSDINGDGMVDVDDVNAVINIMLSK